MCHGVWSLEAPAARRAVPALRTATAARLCVSGALPVAEEIRRWGMVHQAAHANHAQLDGVIDARAVCDAAFAQATLPAAHTTVAPIE